MCRCCSKSARAASRGSTRRGAARCRCSSTTLRGGPVRDAWLKHALLRELVVRPGQPFRQGDDVPAILTGDDLEKCPHQKQSFGGQDVLLPMNGYGGRR